MFKYMKNFVAIKSRAATAVALGLALGLSGGIAGAETLSARVSGAEAVLQKSDRETFVIPEDRLAVTLGTPQGSDEARKGATRMAPTRSGSARSNATDARSSGSN